MDTAPFREAVWYYIHSIKGIRHDDYQYKKVVTRCRLFPNLLVTFLLGERYSKNPVQDIYKNGSLLS